MPKFANYITIIIGAVFVILFILCLLEALFPRWCWKTFESWKATKEPSNAYFLQRRIAGIIGMVVIAAIALALTLVKAYASSPNFINFFIF